MKTRARSAYRRTYLFRELVRQELKSGREVDISLRRRIDLWRHGFLSSTGELYGLTDANRHLYVSDFAGLVRTPFINGLYNPILNDKVVFFHTMRSLGIDTPTLYGMVTHPGRVAWMRSPGEGMPADASALLGEVGEMVLKPFDGGRGDRVMFVSGGSNGSLTVNGAAAGAGGLSELLVPGTLLCERVYQSKWADAIFAGSTNTLRVMTMWDYERDEPFVAFASHRFGTEQSAPIDNVSKGGLAAGIDVATGVIEKAMSLPTAGNLEWLSSHPDTGAQIEGATVQDWDKICDAVLRASQQLAHIPYIGWDVVAGDDHIWMIEGNTYPDVKVQVHHPLLTDPRVRRFYVQHGVIAG